MGNKKVYKKTLFFLSFIFIVAIIAKYYEYNYMNDQAFSIMNTIMNGIKSGALVGNKSFDFPIMIFSKIHFLKKLTIEQSGIVCSIVMNLICFFLLLFNKKYTTKEYLFIYASIFILNMTVFDLNKDIIQFLFVLLIFLIINSNLINEKSKVIISSIIILIETIAFRSYYILIFGLFPLIYFLLKRIYSIETNKKSIIKVLLTIFLFFFAAIYAMKYIDVNSYNELINRRDILETIKANTIMINLISGKGYLIFCINYLINLFRFMIPLELSFKGFKFLIFIIYQLFITINIVNNIRYSGKKTIPYIAFIIAYCMTLAASESDFGTFVRHQSVLFLFYLYIIKDNRYMKGLKNEE